MRALLILLLLTACADSPVAPVSVSVENGGDVDVHQDDKGMTITADPGASFRPACDKVDIDPVSLRVICFYRKR